MRLRSTLRIGLIAFAAAAVAAQGAAWRWDLPAGVAPPPVPAGNAMSAAKVALGRRLFYDGRLSAAGTMSCATCHEQHRAFASATTTHAGIGGDPGRRNVPGLANVAWLPSYTWGDAGVRTLEAQLVTPIFGTHPVEMGMSSPGQIVGRLARDACYRRMFREADPARRGAIDMAGVADALAAFQRTLISYRAPYDAWRRGERGALSPAARRGAAVFAGRCAGCHAGPNLTDGAFHAIAPPDPQAEDRGLFEATGQAADDGRFRTPSLRNVALTGPYLHDGSAPTLAAAIARHGIAPTPEERDALLAFLAALTDADFVADPRFARPATACGAPN